MTSPATFDRQQVAHKRVHFGSYSGCDFSISVHPILKAFAGLETVILGLHCLFSILVDKFCSLTQKNGDSGPAVVYAVRIWLIAIFSLYFNQSEPVTLRRRWDTQTDASAVMAAHRRLSYATRSNGDFYWPVHSLAPSLHDPGGLPLRRLPPRSPAARPPAAHRGDRHGRTMTSYNA